MSGQGTTMEHMQHKSLHFISLFFKARSCHCWIVLKFSLQLANNSCLYAFYQMTQVPSVLIYMVGCHWCKTNAIKPPIVSFVNVIAWECQSGEKAQSPFISGYHNHFSLINIHTGKSTAIHLISFCSFYLSWRFEHPI